jgi:hypothetical protein
MAKMILNHCITEYHSTGPCPIDIDKAVKCWTKRCIISKYNEEYRIYRYTHKTHVAMKVTISVLDAKILIKKLDLVELPSGMYKKASTFVMPGIETTRNL